MQLNSIFPRVSGRIVSVKLVWIRGNPGYKSSSKYVKVSKKGKVTISKKAKKGTYKIKVTVAAKGNYGKCVKYIKIRVK